MFIVFVLDWSGGICEWYMEKSEICMGPRVKRDYVKKKIYEARLCYLITLTGQRQRKENVMLTFFFFFGNILLFFKSYILK